MTRGGNGCGPQVREQAVQMWMGALTPVDNPHTVGTLMVGGADHDRTNQPTDREVRLLPGRTNEALHPAWNPRPPQRVQGPASSPWSLPRHPHRDCPGTVAGVLNGEGPVFAALCRGMWCSPPARHPGSTCTSPEPLSELPHGPQSGLQDLCGPCFHQGPPRGSDAVLGFVP